MTSMHPHWESTDDEQIVPVRSKAPTRQPIRVSRAPAAAVGITVMIVAVTYSFGGLDNLIGQLTNPTPDVTVSINQTGTDPAIVTIKPGQTIRWINNDQIPHVLTAESLPTTDGKPFSTPAMFPGSDAFYTSPAASPERTYDYISATSDQVAGQIVISTVSVIEAPEAPIPNAQPLSTSSGTKQPTMQSSSVSPSPVGANVIAVNPHVVGAKKTPSTSSKKPGVTEHKPKQQTKSGPAVWIVLGCSAAALVLATRGAFRRV